MGLVEEGEVKEGAVEVGAVEDEDAAEAGMAVAALGLSAACPLCSLFRSETMLDMAAERSAMNPIHPSDAGSA
jgi:hypothetical protein